MQTTLNLSPSKISDSNIQKPFRITEKPLKTEDISICEGDVEESSLSSLNDFEICRLCERKVNIEQFNEHSTACLIGNELALRTSDIDEEITQLLEELDSSIYWTSSVWLRNTTSFGPPTAIIGSMSQLGLSTPTLGAIAAVQKEIPLLTETEFASIRGFSKIAHQAIKLKCFSKETLDVLGLLLRELHQIFSPSQQYRFQERSKQICSRLLTLIEAKRNQYASSYSACTLLWPSIDLENSPFFQVAAQSFSLRYSDVIPSLEDFELLKPISKGAYGQVFLCRKIRTGDLFAMKVQKKEHIMRKHNVNRIQEEHTILSKTFNPFIVKLFYSFQTEDHLYLVLEYLPGGDCLSLLEHVGFLEEKTAKIYIAELLLALEYLHSHGIVHRDLKPDNMLISADGHIKLTDFGLSAWGIRETAVQYQQINNFGNNNNNMNLLICLNPTQNNNNNINNPNSSSSPSSGTHPNSTIIVHSNTLSSSSPLVSSESNENSPNLSSTNLSSPQSQSSNSTFSNTVSHTTSNTNTTITSSSSQNSSSPAFRLKQTSNTPMLKSIAQKRPLIPFTQRRQKALSIVGTPDYLAPEVLKGTGYGESADFWALGVVLYEFLFGVTPFSSETPDEVFSKILDENYVIYFPENNSEDFCDIFVSSEARDFISRLLVRNPEKRLGGKEGIKEIKAHPFFQGIEWDQLLNKKTEAPFKPQLSAKEDTTYFSSRENTHPSVNIDEELKQLKLNNNKDNSSPTEKKHIPVNLDLGKEDGNFEEKSKLVVGDFDQGYEDEKNSKNLKNNHSKLTISSLLNNHTLQSTPQLRALNFLNNIDTITPYPSSNNNNTNNSNNNNTSSNNSTNNSSLNNSSGSLKNNKNSAESPKEKPNSPKKALLSNSIQTNTDSSDFNNINNISNNNNPYDIFGGRKIISNSLKPFLAFPSSSSSSLNNSNSNPNNNNNNNTNNNNIVNKSSSSVRDSLFKNFFFRNLSQLKDENENIISKRKLQHRTNSVPSFREIVQTESSPKKEKEKKKESNPSSNSGHFVESSQSSFSSTSLSSFSSPNNSPKTKEKAKKEGFVGKENKEKDMFSWKSSPTTLREKKLFFENLDSSEKITNLHPNLHENSKESLSGNQSPKEPSFSTSGSDKKNNKETQVRFYQSHTSPAFIVKRETNKSNPREKEKEKETDSCFVISPDSKNIVTALYPHLEEKEKEKEKEKENSSYQSSFQKNKDTIHLFHRTSSF